MPSHRVPLALVDEDFNLSDVFVPPWVDDSDETGDSDDSVSFSSDYESSVDSVQLAVNNYYNTQLYNLSVGTHPPVYSDSSSSDSDIGEGDNGLIYSFTPSPPALSDFDAEEVPTDDPVSVSRIDLPSDISVIDHPVTAASFLDANSSVSVNTSSPSREYQVTSLGDFPVGEVSGGEFVDQHDPSDSSDPLGVDSPGAAAAGDSDKTASDVPDDMGRYHFYGQSFIPMGDAGSEIGGSDSVTVTSASLIEALIDSTISAVLGTAVPPEVSSNDAGIIGEPSGDIPSDIGDYEVSDTPREFTSDAVGSFPVTEAFPNASSAPDNSSPASDSVLGVSDIPPPDEVATFLADYLSVGVSNSTTPLNNVEEEYVSDLYDTLAVTTPVTMMTMTVTQPAEVTGAPVTLASLTVPVSSPSTVTAPLDAGGNYSYYEVSFTHLCGNCLEEFPFFTLCIVCRVIMCSPLLISSPLLMLLSPG